MYVITLWPYLVLLPAALIHWSVNWYIFVRV